MARMIFACLVAVLLAPVAGASRPFGTGRPIVHRHVLIVTGGADPEPPARSERALWPGLGCGADQTGAACSSADVLRQNIEASLAARRGLTGTTIGSPAPAGSPYAFVNKAPNVVAECRREFALTPDAQCAHTCDVSKDSCDDKCRTGMNACLAQCPGLGFACDAYCRAAVIVCRSECAKAHGACVDRCPQRRESKRLVANEVVAQ